MIYTAFWKLRLTPYKGSVASEEDLIVVKEELNDVEMIDLTQSPARNAVPTKRITPKVALAPTSKKLTVVPGVQQGPASVAHQPPPTRCVDSGDTAKEAAPRPVAPIKMSPPAPKPIKHEQETKKPEKLVRPEQPSPPRRAAGGSANTVVASVTPSGSRLVPQLKLQPLSALQKPKKAAFSLSEKTIDRLPIQQSQAGQQEATLEECLQQFCGVSHGLLV